MDGPRACRSDELDSLKRVEDTVFRSGVGTSMCDEFPTLLCESNLENIRVMVDDGEVVSAITFQTRDVVVLGNTLSVASLGAVCTYESHRGRGLATVLLEDSFATARESGADVMLISGQRGLYQRAGCAIGGHEVRFSLDVPNAGAGGDSVSVRPAADTDIPDLIAVHQREPVRYARSPSDWAGFLSVCRLVHPAMPEPAGVKRCWLVEAGGEVVATVVLQFGGTDNPHVAQVVEFSGARWAAVEAMLKLAAQYDVHTLAGPLLPQDTEMLARLRDLGASMAPGLLAGHRMSILNEDILHRYRPWLTERCGAECANAMSVARGDADTWELRLGDEVLPIADLEQLNAVLFADAADALDGPADVVAAWRLALPLPWLLPGLNYI